MRKSDNSDGGRKAGDRGQLWLRLPGLVGEGRVAVSRPRVRSVEGRELKLPSWQEWSARDPLEQRALEQMVLGISTRRYARSLEPLPQTVQVRGVSKSAVSDRFVYGTERKLAELMSRNLRGLA